MKNELKINYEDFRTKKLELVEKEILQLSKSYENQTQNLISTSSEVGKFISGFMDWRRYQTDQHNHAPNSELIPKSSLPVFPNGDEKKS